MRQRIFYGRKFLVAVVLHWFIYYSEVRVHDRKHYLVCITLLFPLLSLIKPIIILLFSVKKSILKCLNCAFINTEVILMLSFLFYLFRAIFIYFICTIHKFQSIGNHFEPNALVGAHQIYKKTKKSYVFFRILCVMWAWSVEFVALFCCSTSNRLILLLMFFLVKW